MSDTRSSRRADALAILCLLATSVVIGLPIISGGYLTYVDNPVHLAEIHELWESASDWSELSFAGFALGTLHSPLWYGLLAWLEGFGLGVPAYVVLLVLGFAAPAMALYAVARRRTTPMRAGGLAALLLIQAPMVSGLGSPFAGMFTHTLGAAGVILLADWVTRRPRPPQLDWMIAMAVAFIGLTHLFALLIAALVVAITLVTGQKAGELKARNLMGSAVGWAVASLACATYWLSFALGLDPGDAPHDSLGPLGLGIRLLLPSDVLLLVNSRLGEAINYDLYLTDALPMLALVGLGIVGFLSKHEDRTAKVGFLTAAFLLLCLLIHPHWHLKWIGPVSWRLLYWVRLGLALSAIPLVAKLPAPVWLRDRRGIGMTLATVCMASGFWWGKPLATESPPHMKQDVADAGKLWAYLAKHGDPSWGRLYLQDTFGQDWSSGGMAHSHLLVQTKRHSGVPQLGTYYGVVPVATRWTISEFNTLYREARPVMERHIEHMKRTNAGAMVTSNAGAEAWLDNSGKFERLTTQGRYALWKLRGGQSQWTMPLWAGDRVEDMDWSPARMSFHLITHNPSSRLVVKSTYHRGWRVSGIAGATLEPTPDGLMVINHIPAGSHQVRLWYEDNPWPSRASALGWLLLFGWGTLLGFSARSRGYVP